MFYGEMIHSVKKRGFKILFGTVASNKAFKIALNLGGTVLKEIGCEDPGM
jgi:hypothetical protein